MQFPDLIPKKDEHSWATWCPGRRPEFKVHSSEGLAHSALGNRGFYLSKAKYRLTPAGWEKVWEYHPPRECPCGKEYRSASMYGRAYYEDIDHIGSKWNMVPRCYDCYQEGSQKKKAAEDEKRERAQLAALQAKYSEKT